MGSPSFYLGLKGKLFGNLVLYPGWDLVGIRPLVFQQIPNRACLMCEDAGPGLLEDYVCFLSVCQSLMLLCLGMENLGGVRMS